jgi:hypothetical protein
MKITNDAIRNLNRERPACSAVPQPTGPLCTHMIVASFVLFLNEKVIHEIGKFYK